MGYAKRNAPEGYRFETWSSEDQEQCEDTREDQREASNLVSFVAISLFLSVICGLAGILSGRI